MSNFKGWQLIVIVIIGILVFWAIWPNAAGLVIFAIILCVYVIVMKPNDLT